MKNIHYEIPEQYRPNPPQGGSGVIKAPVRIEFDDEFKAIIVNLTYMLGTANIEFRLNVDDKYIDNEAVKKILIDAVHNGDIKFSFTPNQL